MLLTGLVPLLVLGWVGQRALSQLLSVAQAELARRSLVRRLPLWVGGVALEIAPR